MTAPRHASAATVDLALPAHLVALRDRFAAAWRQTLAGGPPPSMTEFLAVLSTSDAALLRPALAQVEADYRGGSTVGWPSPPNPGGATIDLPPEPRGGGELGGGLRQQPIMGTVDFRPDDTSQFVPGGHGGTLDFVVDAGAQADGAGLGGSIGASVAGSLTGTEAAAAGKVQELPTVAGYQILGVLGRGAMGVVYKARQRGLQRVVALKMILAGGHASEHDIARFRSEAEAVGQLQHPYIVQVYEVGEQDGNPYFSLEYVDGGSLNKKIHGEPQPVVPAAHLTMLLAQGMAAAHAKGIVHRDLKPANVMLTSPRLPGAEASLSGSVSMPPYSEALYGTPKIADFGLAKRLEEESGQTRSGTILGTPSYMAPEQAEGKSKEVGPLADVYALGAVLYELLTGRPPFRGDSLWDTLEQVRTREPVPPSQLNPKVPRDLETICLKCLQKERPRRYGSAQELAEDLRRFQTGEPIVARPVGAAERLWRWCCRNPTVAALAATAALLLVAGTVVSTAFAIEAQQRAEEAEIARDDAKDKQKLAQDNEAKAVREQQRADREKKLAQDNEAKALAEKQRAERNKQAEADQRKVAQQAFKTMIEEVQKQLKDTEGMTEQVRELRKKMLLVGAEGLEKIADVAAKNLDSTDDDPGLARRARASAFFDIGRMYFQDLGDPAKAVESYQKAFALLKAEAEANPKSDKARGNLALAHTLVGDMHLETGSGARKALAEYAQALTLRETIRDHPSDGNYSADDARRMVADSHRKLALVATRLGDPALAKKYHLLILAYVEEQYGRDEAQADPKKKTFKSADDYLRARAATHLALADLSWRVGDEAAMNEFQQKGLAAREQLADKLKAPSLRLELALAYGTCGDGQLRLGRLDKAGEYYRKSHALLEALALKDAGKYQYRFLLANVYYRRGTLALLLGDADEAHRFFDKSLRMHQALAVRDDKKGPPRETVMLGLARTGDHEAAAALAAAFAKHHAQNPERLFQAACAYALCAAAAGPGHARHEEYAAKAVAYLAQATSGDFKDPVGVDTDPDLAPLRERDDYRRVLADVRKRAAG
jgi:tetratricopeptide (TPR) repeat protein